MLCKQCFAVNSQKSSFVTIDSRNAFIIHKSIHKRDTIPCPHFYDLFYKQFIFVTAIFFSALHTTRFTSSCGRNLSKASALPRRSICSILGDFFLPVSRVLIVYDTNSHDYTTLPSHETLF